jgi:hypothetical protein
VNLRRTLVPLAKGELGLVTNARAASRRKLGFLLCGDGVMPDHGHALNNFALDKLTVAHCPIEIDQVHLPESYRG